MKLIRKNCFIYILVGYIYSNYAGVSISLQHTRHDNSYQHSFIPQFRRRMSSHLALTSTWKVIAMLLRRPCTSLKQASSDNSSLTRNSTLNISYWTNICSFSSPPRRLTLHLLTTIHICITITTCTTRQGWSLTMVYR